MTRINELLILTMTQILLELLIELVIFKLLIFVMTQFLLILY